MLELEKPAFDAEAYLTSAGPGCRIVKLREKQTFFSQGEAADSVFYLQSGRAKLTVVSKYGKEARITLLSTGEFVGEESLASAGALHRSTATSITDCTAFKIEREEMLRSMQEDHPLSQIFIQFLLARNMRIHSDLVDQLFISGERRLAKILLLMAEFGEGNESEGLIRETTDESLAKLIGAPQSCVNFFMSRFHELGFIDYDGRIRVHKALLNAVLHDQLPGDNAAQPEIIGNPRRHSNSAESTN
jgi:CRP/FNR family cyclic AMP-dependent transcriptional regulator